MKKIAFILFIVKLFLALSQIDGLSTKASDCTVCEGCCDVSTSEPVCGEEGRQFLNECYAIHCAKVSIKCHAVCPCEKKCPNCPTIDVEAVCGRNNQTYQSKCLADCNSISVECQHACPCWG
uniref:Thrombin inhibitor rhodniin n=1 Tax=Lepeophtheirus salmonis TaxID=72036 RepID=D3PHG5_LEPSM|nr:Thrombin inhibitor rhodniin [Lepeophtheirus salmonis]